MGEELSSRLRALIDDGAASPDVRAKLADLLAAAVEREARVAALVRELGQATETQRFLAEASEALALSLDDRTTLSVLAHLAVPRVADWCIVDLATADGAVTRGAVTHVEGEDSALAASLLAASIEPGVIGPESRELLAGDLASAEGLPADLVEAAGAIEAKSAIVVYALGASGGSARIALFAGRSGRRLGYDDFALAEELARRASQALERASLYGEAQRANEAKDVFLATVSHELRGPLAAISMWTHVLGLRSCDEPTRQKALRAIEASVSAQGRLIEDMIDLSRLLTGSVCLDVAPLSLAKIVQTAVEEASAAAREKGVALLFQGESEAMLTGDAHRLLQVFGGLVANAIEFTPAGGNVDVSLVRGAVGVRVVVRDDGEGMSPGFLAHVFTPFRQEDASLTRARGGLGLGLAMAKQIVLLHGGTIRVESAGRNTGATFTVELPLASALTARGSDR